MGGEADWYQTFFEEPWLQVQRQSWTPEQTRVHADTILEVLQLPAGAKILDAPCGEGRLSVELAARGYEVTGVDITERLLEDARRGADKRQLHVMWELGDMRHLPWQDEFDAVICWWGSFGYFDEQGNAAQAESAARALKRGGGYLIDTNVADSLLAALRSRDWRRVGNTIVLEERQWDHERARIETDWTFIAEENESAVHSSIRLYTYHELCALLQDCGFSLCQGYDAHTREPFAFGSRRLLMLATK